MASSIRILATFACIFSIFAFLLPQLRSSKFALLYGIVFGCFFLMVALSYFGGSKILRLQAKCVPAPENSFFRRNLSTVVKNLGISKLPNVFITNSGKLPKPCCTIGNFFESSLVIYHPSIDLLDKEDWHAILCHEASHIKNRDMIFMTWARSYLWLINYWFASFAAVVIITQIVLGSSLSIILSNSIPLLLAAWFFLIFLPQLIVNSVSRLGELLADERALTIVDKRKLFETLRKCFLMEYTLAKTSQKSRINSIEASILARIPTRLYNLTFAQYPTISQRLKPLNSKDNVSKQVFKKPIDVETPFWSGVASFLALVGILLPISNFLSGGNVELLIVFPGVILAILNNIWLVKVEDKVIAEGTYSRFVPTSFEASLFRTIFLQACISSGTFVLIISPFSLGGSTSISSFLIGFCSVFGVLLLMSVVVSLIIVIIKKSHYKLSNN